MSYSLAITVYDDSDDEDWFDVFHLECFVLLTTFREVPELLDSKINDRRSSYRERKKVNSIYL